jgi:hypothetical protein
VNDVGHAVRRIPGEVPIEEFWRAIRLDLFGTFLGCRFGIPAIIASGGGSVRIAPIATPPRWDIDRIESQVARLPSHRQVSGR